ncbi:MAG: hypothetical protein JSW50_02805 [Candidatus Latescibacterota bacterium]|nr:MAG: hypothetical protein JSW50_02805 [Candidatus Latescibacterota bacterium]
MKKCLLLPALLLVAVLVGSCSEEPPVAPETDSPQIAGLDLDPAAVAAELVAKSGWVVDEASTGADASSVPTNYVTHVNSEPLHGDIVHYSYDIPVGPGPYDMIRLHRVVKEGGNDGPIRSRKTIFLLHGDLIGFVKFIFGSVTPYLPDNYSLAVFLAENGVDVWGMDQNWVLVPGGLADYSFSAGWDVQNQVDNLRAGMSIAREARLMTGNGFGKLNLLGYSSGGATGYAYINEETQLPPGHRNVKGFIAADIGIKFDTSKFEWNRQYWCETADYYQSLLDSGVYNPGWGDFFTAMGYLAETAPDDPSPLIPGFTNLQVALYLGAVPEVPENDWYHYVAGIFVDDFPVDLRFTQIGSWLDFVQTAAPFEPLSFTAEYSRLFCDEVDLPYDDYLDEVTIPVLLVSAAGGFGETGFYSLDLLGSSDKTIHHVSLNPPELLDFGHIDLWTADNSKMDAWVPILEWIDDRTPGRGNTGQKHSD